MKWITKIDRELKINLLRAIQIGEIDMDIFPGLKGKGPIDLIRRPRVITKEEFRQIWEGFDEKY